MSLIKSSDKMNAAISAFEKAMKEAEAVSDETGISFSIGNHESYIPFRCTATEEEVQAAIDSHGGGREGALALIEDYQDLRSTLFREHKKLYPEADWAERNSFINESMKDHICTRLPEDFLYTTSPTMLLDWVSGVDPTELEDSDGRPIFGWVSSVGSC